MRVITFTTSAVIIFLSFLTYLARHHIADLFTDDPELAALTSKVLIVAAIVYLFDGSQGFLQGPIRALGLQKRASYLALAMNWAVGVPLAAICAFTLDFGLVGLQGGFSSAMIGQSLGYMLILKCKDWHEIADEVASRINKEAGELNSRHDDDQYKTAQ